MAKDEKMPNEAEIARFLVYLEQTILYLEKDEMFRSLLTKLLGGVNQKHRIGDVDGLSMQNQPVIEVREKIVEKRIEVPVEKIVEKFVEKKIEFIPEWAKSLESEQVFLKQVRAHAEITKILLPNGDENVLQLIVIAAQWNNVLRVWDVLATQIKNNKTAISVNEQQILEHCLALFNLTLQSNQASLQMPEIGDRYDYEVHQKVSGSGGSIEQVLLAGLCNAANEQVRTTIVITN